MTPAIDDRDVKALAGGRLWKRISHPHQEMWDSNCGGFRIVELPNAPCEYLLISWIHEGADDGDVWRKKFATLEEAMEYAEAM